MQHLPLIGLHVCNTTEASYSAEKTLSKPREASDALQTSSYFGTDRMYILSITSTSCRALLDEPRVQAKEALNEELQRGTTDDVR